jgi:hypothetical protein
MPQLKLDVKLMLDDKRKIAPVAAPAIIFAPLVHRLLHHFHAEDDRHG